MYYVENHDDEGMIERHGPYDQYWKARDKAADMDWFGVWDVYITEAE